MAGLWQTPLPAASVFCVSLQSDVVFACDVAEHLKALSSSCCFAQHPALYYIPQQRVMPQSVPYPFEFAPVFELPGGLGVEPSNCFLNLLTHYQIMYRGVSYVLYTYDLHHILVGL